MLAALIWQESRTTSPLIPPRLFREPSIWRSDGLAACHGAALVSLITFLPIYLRAVRGASPAETGLMLLPLTFGIGVGSLITGQIVTRTGRTAVFPSLGLPAATIGLLLLAFWTPHLSTTALPWAWGAIALCMGTVMGVVQLTVQSVAGPRRLGTGAAMVQFSRSVGAAFGTAAVAAVLFAILATGDRDTAASVRHDYRGGTGSDRNLGAGPSGHHPGRNRRRVSLGLHYHRGVHRHGHCARLVAAAAPRVAADMTKILLTRHGHVEGITPERFRGREPLD